MYVLQFVCYDLWPTVKVGPGFPLFLAASAVVAVHAVQEPAARVWRAHPSTALLGAPALLCVLLVCLRALPLPFAPARARLPETVRHGPDAVDVRLPLVADKAEGDDPWLRPAGGGGKVALINPSLLYWGDWLVVAARRHWRHSSTSVGTHRGQKATIVEEVWHSDIALGAAGLVGTEWLVPGLLPGG